MRAAQRGVEEDRLLGGGAGIGVAAEVAEHEGEEVVRVGVVGGQVHRSLEGLQRIVVSPAVVEHLAVVEPDHRRVGVQLAGTRQPLRRRVEPPAPLLRDAELEHRPRVARPLSEDGRELRHRVVQLPDRGVRPGQLGARVEVAGPLALPLAQRGDALVVDPGLRVDDLEIALRHHHPRVEGQRPGERLRRLLVEALPEIEDAQVVVRPGVGRIDPTGEGPQDGEVAFRGHGRRPHRAR